MGWRYCPNTHGDIATDSRGEPSIVPGALMVLPPTARLSNMCACGIAQTLVGLPLKREDVGHVCWRYCHRTAVMSKCVGSSCSELVVLLPREKRKGSYTQENCELCVLPNHPKQRTHRPHTARLACRRASFFDKTDTFYACDRAILEMSRNSTEILQVAAVIF